jgi:hypothetical protein
VSRVLSITLRQAIFAQTTDRVAAVLITFFHPDLVEPIRISTDPTQRISETELIYGTISRGDQFVFIPVNAIYPDDQDESAPRAKLSMDNISLAGLQEGVFRVSDLLQLAPTPAAVLIEVVLSSTPDLVEVAWDELMMTRATFNFETVEIEMSMDNFATEPFPSGMFTPGSFPTLF